MVVADRQRWWLCALLLAVTILSYVDRQAFSIAAPVLAAEFHFTNRDVAMIVNAFLIAYTVGQVFAGRFMDRVGVKRGFSLIVLGWSTAAALMGLGGSVLSFSAFRGALGLAEAGNFPGGVKAVAEWFSPEERSTAVGIFTSGASIGAIVTPPLFAYMIATIGWQMSFVATAIPGILWVVVWLGYWRAPQAGRVGGRHGVAPADEAGDGIGEGNSVHWTWFLRQRMVWGVLLARFLEEPVSWFYLTWLPIYMRTYREASIVDIGLALIFPFIALDLGYVGGGWIASRLMKAGWSMNRARKAVMTGSALCMAAGIPAVSAGSTPGFVAWVSLATMGHGGWGSNIFTLPGDFAPRKWVGTVYGMTAFGGGVGAVLFTWLIGILTDVQGSFQAVFFIAGTLPILAAVVILTVPGKITPLKVPGTTQC
jgi:MFS transporter, ACS family, hexuronate transporter